MQITMYLTGPLAVTIEQAEFDRLATQAGYIKLEGFADRILEQVGRSVEWRLTSALIDEGVIPETTAKPDGFLEAVSALEEPEDLKPKVPPVTRKEVTAAFRKMVDARREPDDDSQSVTIGKAILKKLGVPTLAMIPDDKLTECMQLLERSEKYPDADKFAESIA